MAHTLATPLATCAHGLGCLHDGRQADRSGSMAGCRRDRGLLASGPLASGCAGTSCWLRRRCPFRLVATQSDRLLLRFPQARPRRLARQSLHDRDLTDLRPPGHHRFAPHLRGLRCPLRRRRACRAECQQRESVTRIRGRAGARQRRSRTPARPPSGSRCASPAARTPIRRANSRLRQAKRKATPSPRRRGSSSERCVRSDGPAGINEVARHSHR